MEQFQAAVAFLRDGGPWALVVIVGWVLKRHDDKLDAERKGRQADAALYATTIQDLLTRTVTVLERAATCMAAVTAALESRTGHFERLGDLVEEIKALVRDLERESATADERVRDKLDTHAERLKDIIDAIGKLRPGLAA